MKTVDVSGMGGGYENACQKMIEAGLKYFKEHGVPTVEDLNDEKSAFSQGLEKVMIEASNNDCTGAMFYTSRAHAYKRASLGEEEYFKLFVDDPGRVYEWDGTVATVPVTEISQKMEGH